jgi:phosphate transport system ATP-binding protein
LPLPATNVPPSPSIASVAMEQSAMTPPRDPSSPSPSEPSSAAATSVSRPTLAPPPPVETIRRGAPATVTINTSAQPSAEPTVTPRLSVHGLNAFFGAACAVRDVSVVLPDRFVTAIIGPSGCGKSTLLRCLNRMHETLPLARVEGQVMLDGQDIYGRAVNVTALRQHIGMVFQRPTPFPTMSIRDNVAAALLTAPPRPSRADTDEIVERALRRTALWDEVKDRLRDSATGLSGGQQQRLCIARALAIEPEVLLLDEPTASLDPISTQKVEELVYELRRDMTVVIVTHNMQQAARVSDRTAFMLAGELVEVAPTTTLFTTPRDPRTEAYITGRFG